MWDAILNFFANKNHSFPRKLAIGILVIISLIFIDGYIGFTTLYFETRKTEALSNLSNILKDTSIDKSIRVIAEQEFHKVANYNSWKDGLKRNGVIAVRALSQVSISQAVNKYESSRSINIVLTVAHILSSGWMILLIASEVILKRESGLSRKQKLFGFLIAFVIASVNAVIFLFLPAPDDFITRLVCNAGYAVFEIILFGVALMLFNPDIRIRFKNNNSQQH